MKEIACPDSEGLWLHVPSGNYIEIYELSSVDGTLCLWGPDVGITYNGAADTQAIWMDDAWQGHIPVVWYDDKGPWAKIAEMTPVEL